jgi:hypothetical protein
MRYLSKEHDFVSINAHQVDFIFLRVGVVLNVAEPFGFVDLVDFEVDVGIVSVTDIVGLYTLELQFKLEIVERPAAHLSLDSLSLRFGDIAQECL